MGSGANLEALRIPLIAVATNHGLTSWERGGIMDEGREGERGFGGKEGPSKMLKAIQTHLYLYNDSL